MDIDQAEWETMFADMQALILTEDAYRTDS